jgi:cytoskeletal protein CcmA (bactofilin family)
MNGVRHVVIVLLVALAVFATALTPVQADPGQSTTIVGQDYVLAEGRRLENDLVVVRGNARLERDTVVEGNFVVVSGEVVVEGTVKGDVTAFGSTVELGATAVLEKDLVVFGTLRRDPQAVVKGNVIEGLEATKRLSQLPALAPLQRMATPDRPQTPQVPETLEKPVRPNPPVRTKNVLGDLVRNVLVLMTVAIVAAVVATVFPTNLNRINKMMSEYVVLSAGLGALSFVVVALVASVLAITCIGAPVALVALVLFILCTLVGWAAAGRMLGFKLYRALRWGGQTTLSETVVGSLVLALAALIPCVGGLLAFGVASWGLGATLLTRGGTQPYPTPFVAGGSPTPAAPPTPPAAPLGPDAPPAPTRRDTHKLDESTLRNDD